MTNTISKPDLIKKQKETSILNQKKNNYKECFHKHKHTQNIEKKNHYYVKTSYKNDCFQKISINTQT